MSDEILDSTDLDQQPDEQDDRSRPRGWAGWMISVGFHSLLVLVMSSIYYLIAPPQSDPLPVRSVTIDPPPQKEVKDKRELVEKIELNIPVEAEKPNPLPVEELPVDVASIEDPTEEPAPQGRDDAVVDSELGSTGVFMAIGSGSSGAGMYGKRKGGGKTRAIAAGGGSHGSEAAVGGALRWLKRHQSQNGMWDCVGYTANCGDGLKCEPGVKREGDPNVAMTGYAVLCYLGAGYDHIAPNRYQTTVKKGVDYLVSVQKADGMLGERNYENAIAAMALAEAYGMTGDPALKTPAQNAVNAILAHQNTDQSGGAKDHAYAGFGWDYLAPNARNDSSVSGWNVMALKSALASGLSIGNGTNGAKMWLEKTWKATNPNWATLDPYHGESRFPYTIMSDTSTVNISAAPAAGAPSPDEQDLSCVGAVCAVFLGHHAGDVMLETLANYIMNHETPTAYPCNTYKMYYNTISMFQLGGDRWKKWNSSVRDLLVNAQRKGDGCFDGSWDHVGTKFPGHDTGRVLSTVYGCLSLEVYYRYEKAARDP